MTTKGINEFFKRFVTGILLIVCFGGSYLHSTALFSFFLIGVCLLVLIFEWPRLVPLRQPYYIFVSVLYPTIPILSLLWLTLYFRTTDFYLPLYPFFVSWSADTGGYIVGKLWGRHKIYPSISPGKSWEGLLGSIIGVHGMHLILIPHIKHFSSTTLFQKQHSLFLFSIVITIVAFLGGFFLSYLKRKQGLKDAGIALPGHGGFLDRFDAVFFVAVTTVILTLIFK